MIKEVIHQSYNKITESDFVNTINENVLTQKVKELSESYIFSIGSRTLFASLTLKAVCSVSLSTSFPICLALIAFTSLMNFAVNSIKEAIKALVKKGREYLTRIAQVISDIFEAICTSINSFALQAIHLKDKVLSFDKKLPINYAVITDNEPFTEEAISYFIVPNLIAQSSVALEKSAALTASIEEAPQIQEDIQIVTFAPPQKEIPETEKKAKKSEILSKFEQLCAVSRFAKEANYPSFQQLNYTTESVDLSSKSSQIKLNYPSFQQSQNQYQSPVLPIGKMPKIVLPKLGRNSEDQGLITTTPTFNSSSIKIGMKVLNLVKKLK
ncbi:MAG: hypothetical protein AABZ92_03535 [Verrucomicrobiota bacterium]